MKDIFSAAIERCRVSFGEYTSRAGDRCGMFFVRHPKTLARLRVIVGCGLGWDHVSVSHASRCPTWQEMDWVKRQFFDAGEVAIQYHVTEADHINVHPNCLHMWRPHDERIPTPPKEMV